MGQAIDADSCFVVLAASAMIMRDQLGPNVDLRQHDRWNAWARDYIADKAPRGSQLAIVAGAPKPRIIKEPRERDVLSAMKEWI